MQTVDWNKTKLKKFKQDGMEEDLSVLFCVQNGKNQMVVRLNKIFFFYISKNVIHTIT